MMHGEILIFSLFVPVLAGLAACCLPLSSRAALRVSAAAAGLECAVVAAVFVLKGHTSRIFACANNLFIDSLSLYHIGLVSLVFFMSAVYSVGYFSDDIDRGAFGPKRARRYTLLWNSFFAILIAVLCSNNMGILWICLEATTLVSALLILSDGRPASIEAMWKYLLLCSVGIAFAFVGTLLLSVAARAASFPPEESLLWTSLADKAGLLDGRIMCAAFVFALVGFGTKAGLAPMHSWLPDAHSQAPTPVSAVFSGVMLNCALYCIMRYLPLCESAMGWRLRAHAMLVLMGLLSIIVAAIFIPSQKNIKRLLAYHSVEHMGIIALGLGIGGLGTLAALYHTFNHTMSKTLAFFSAGRLGRQYKTYDMTRITGAIASNSLWGTAFFVSILALIGVAPFSVFMSEFMLVKASLDAGKFVGLAVFFFGSIVVFVSALRHAIDVSMGAKCSDVPPPRRSLPDVALVAVCVGALIVFGLFMPHWYYALLGDASSIVEGARILPPLSGGLFH
jgi:hydrogenase-4 component F